MEGSYAVFFLRFVSRMFSKTLTINLKLYMSFNLSKRKIKKIHISTNDFNVISNNIKNILVDVET